MASNPERLPQTMQNAFSAFMIQARTAGMRLPIKRSRQERLAEITTTLVNHARTTPGAIVSFPEHFFDDTAAYGTSALQYIADIIPLVLAAKYLIDCFKSDAQYQEFSAQMTRLFGIPYFDGASLDSPQVVFRTEMLAALAQSAMTHRSAAAISENTHPPLSTAPTSSHVFKAASSIASVSASPSASAHTAGPYEHYLYFQIKHPPVPHRHHAVVPPLAFASAGLGGGAPITARTYPAVPDTTTERTYE